MQHAVTSLRPALRWAHWRPAVGQGLLALALFVFGIALVRLYAVPLRAELAAHGGLGAMIFVLSAAVAVLMPLLTNLPLVPLAALAWGPETTAALLLLGWAIGAMLAFAAGRHAREPILRRFPAVMRHAQIERLIHPRHRLLSLTLLRMTFPVDVLSYALGLFSPRTGWRDNLLSTLIGAVPFAIVFAWFPVLDGAAQTALFVSCALAFAGWAAWVLRDTRAGAQ